MDRGRSDRGVHNPIDVHVGSRLHLRRTLLGMSQKKLGEAAVPNKAIWPKLGETCVNGAPAHLLP